MPHALSLPSPGLQAIILCGPGHSFETFTSDPEDLPKALLPVANRPMVWYPLHWCYRMGISSILLVSPPSAQNILEAALSQNPYLTSLPMPRPIVVCPANLTPTSGTAELLRSPEVQAAIKRDFLVAPCDLVCEVSGESLLDAWMGHQPDLTPSSLLYNPPDPTIISTPPSNFRGGLSLWYQTTGENAVKNEETDFLITTTLSSHIAVPRGITHGSLHELAYLSTSATLKDMTSDGGTLPIRHSLMRRYGRLKILHTYRDSHVYVLPYWILDFVNRNVSMDSISEDVLGAWAKACWQEGLGSKLGLTEILRTSVSEISFPSTIDDVKIETISPVNLGVHENTLETKAESNPNIKSKKSSEQNLLDIPRVSVLLHNNDSHGPMVRRVDTPALLMQVSLRLARIELSGDADEIVSPYAHPHKIANQSGIAPRSTITRGDCLLDHNVTVEEKSVIKESVIGSNCHIKTGARITRCVLMDGVTVGEKCQLTGCILGKRSQIGRNCTLRECEVQNGNHIPENTEAKNEKFIVFDGLDGNEEFDDSKGFISHTH